MESLVKAKYSIILALESAPVARMSNTIDDGEISAKKLWDAFSNYIPLQIPKR